MPILDIINDLDLATRLLTAFTALLIALAALLEALGLLLTALGQLRRACRALRGQHAPTERRPQLRRQLASKQRCGLLAQQQGCMQPLPGNRTCMDII